MLISNFADSVVSAMGSYLPLKMQNDVVVKKLDVLKLNDQRRTGITIRKGEGDTIAPTFYLDEAFEQYENGRPFELIMKELADMYLSAIENIPCFDIEESFNKGNLSARVVSTKLNTSLLDTVPYRSLGHDLALIADFELNESYRTKCTEDLLKSQNMDAEDVLNRALENTERNKPAVLTNFPEGYSAPLDKFPSDIAKSSNMLVLTTEDGCFGAVTLFYPDTLKRIADLLEEDFYLIPSSVHEWIITKAEGQCDANITWMLRSANESVVSEDEVLSNNALYYEVATATLRDVA